MIWIWCRVGICAAGLLAVSCATTQGRYVLLGPSYAPISQDLQIAVFREGSPERPFVKISRLDVHLEKTHFVASSFEDALPELRKQARLSGAEAIVEIQERSSMVGETRIYHVTATGIRYRAP